MSDLKAVWRVRAGIYPDVGYSRDWSITKAEYEGKSEAEKLLLFHQQKEAANEYASGLMNPGFANWVAVEFVWL